MLVLNINLLMCKIAHFNIKSPSFPEGPRRIALFPPEAGRPLSDIG